MKWAQLKIVWRKEVIDLLRDRRTILSMLIIPLLVIPIITMGLGTVAVKVIAKARAEIPSIMIVGGKDSPGTVERLRKMDTVKVVPFSANFTNLISDKQIRAAVEIPDGFDASLVSGTQKVVKIYVYGGEIKSQFGASPLQDFFHKLREDTIKDRMAARQVPDHLLHPFDIHQENVATERKVAGNLLGAIMPYMIILLCMTGAMYPAMDLTAGEKERGTIETLLCSPVARVNIVMGKFFAVLTFALATTFFSLASMSGTFLIGKKFIAASNPGAFSSNMLVLDLTSLVMVFVMILPVAVFLSAAQLAIALAAKSFKEAQSYLSPLMILVIIPAALGMLPGMEMSSGMAWIPILNTSLISKELLIGNYPWGQIAMIFLSSCVYAALAIAAAVWQFNREEVLFRT